MHQQLPQAFVNERRSVFVEQCKLKAAENYFDVKLQPGLAENNEENCFYFTDYWKEFVRGFRLREYDILTFKTNLIRDDPWIVFEVRGYRWEGLEIRLAWFGRNSRRILPYTNLDWYMIRRFHLTLGEFNSHQIVSDYFAS